MAAINYFLPGKKVVSGGVRLLGVDYRELQAVDPRKGCQLSVIWGEKRKISRFIYFCFQDTPLSQIEFSLVKVQN